MMKATTRRKPGPTPAQIVAALEFQSLRPPRTACRWLVHWLTRSPTIAKYQQPVPLSRVLSEHAAAIAAEPIDEGEQ